jgi:hypothetical protein
MAAGRPAGRRHGSRRPSHFRPALERLEERALFSVTPSIQVVLSPSPVSEGSATTATGTLADPITGNAHTVVLSWGDGSTDSTLPLAAGTTAFSATHTYLDEKPNATDTVTATTTIESTAVSGTASITVQNVAPTNVVQTGLPNPVDEGSTLGLGVTFQDPGTQDLHTAVVDWGDGTSTTLDLPAGQSSFSTSHVYLDPGAIPGHSATAATATITTTVTDDGGASGSVTNTVTVNNIAPAGVQVSLNAAQVSEGDTATATGSFTDPGTQELYTVVLDWGGNETPTTLSLAAGVTTFSATHTYLDEAPGGAQDTLTATVTDDSGASGSGSTIITVTNVTPSNVSVSLDTGSVGEGGTVTATGSFTDPGTQDLHTVVLDWGDGSAPDTLALDAGVTAFSGTHTYLDEAPGGAQDTLTATVTDDGGASASGTTTVTVTNVTPSDVSVSLNTASAPEGSVVTASGTFTDPGTQDLHTVVLDWGDSSSPTTLSLAAGVTNFSATHTYLDELPNGGNDSLTATVTDDGGASASGTTTVTVTNVTPSGVSVSLNTGSVGEGGTVTATGSFTDPGTQDLHTVVLNWGDSSTTATTLSLAAGLTTFSATHTYLDELPNPTDTVTATVTDDGGASASGTTTVTVTNVTPSNVSVSLNAANVNEGGVVTATGSFTDPGTLDLHTVVLNWGGNETPTTLNLAAGLTTFSVTHTYLDDKPNPLHTVTSTVTDDGGASGSATTTITVNNVAPTNVQISLNPSAVSEGGTVMVTGSFIDPGTQDLHTVVIDFGDGSATDTLHLPAGVTTFTDFHQFTSGGTDTVTAVVNDDSGGTGFGSTTIAVGTVAPALTNVQITSVPEGGTATLTGNIVDPSPTEAFTLLVDWGDGSAVQAVSFAAGTTSFTLGHQYLTEGTRTVSLQVTSTGGGAGTASTSVAVTEGAVPAGVSDTPANRFVNEIFEDLLHTQPAASTVQFWGYVLTSVETAYALTASPPDPASVNAFMQFATFRLLLGGNPLDVTANAQFLTSLFVETANGFAAASGSGAQRAQTYYQDFGLSQDAQFGTYSNLLGLGVPDFVVGAEIAADHGQTLSS